MAPRAFHIDIINLYFELGSYKELGQRLGISAINARDKVTKSLNNLMLRAEYKLDASAYRSKEDLRECTVNKRKVTNSLNHREFFVELMHNYETSEAIFKQLSPFVHARSLVELLVDNLVGKKIRLTRAVTGQRRIYSTGLPLDVQPKGVDGHERVVCLIEDVVVDPAGFRLMLNDEGQLASMAVDPTTTLQIVDETIRRFQPPFQENP